MKEYLEKKYSIEDIKEFLDDVDYFVEKYATEDRKSKLFNIPEVFERISGAVEMAMWNLERNLLKNKIVDKLKG